MGGNIATFSIVRKYLFVAKILAPSPLWPHALSALCAPLFTSQILRLRILIQTGEGELHFFVVRLLTFWKQLSKRHQRSARRRSTFRKSCFDSHFFWELSKNKHLCTVSC